MKKPVLQNFVEISRNNLSDEREVLSFGRGERGAFFYETALYRVKESARHVMKEATAASMMVKEQLEKRLPDTSLLEALCLVTPRFWVQIHLQYSDDDRNA